MKYTIRIILLACVSLWALIPSAYWATDYTTLRNIDLGTYNEYRYRLTEQFFALREHFEVTKELNTETLQNIALIANTGYKYLPDNLTNKNKLQELLIDIKKWMWAPDNKVLYSEVIKSLAAYLEKVEIQEIEWTISATPNSGNAPLTVTLRWAVQDPTGTQILPGNYTWWVDSAGKKVVIWRGPSINFTFKEEGKYSIFLDVTSVHKNAEGYTDVLPFRSRAEVTIKEKIASLIINIDGDRVEDNEVLKFTPDDANYGLLFDASSSTPTWGAKFIKTQWDFGNGATRSYNGPPKIERVRYGAEGDYNVKLRLETNEWKSVERNFALIIRDPIARIETNRDDGFIGDSFTFSAKSSGLERNLTYNWEIVDIDNEQVLLQKSDKILTHVFTKKWKYNVRLKVRQSSGEVDQDNYIVYVTSQPPIAEFNSRIPLPNKPNRVQLDASRSYDPDFSDDGNLKYDWFIDGERVSLSDANKNGSFWYYTFDSIGSHSVNLEVTDPDGIVDIKKWEVTISSTLSVEMEAFPRVIQRGGFIKFEVDSPEAEVYEWDFWDGKNSWWSFNKITHVYEKSGSFAVQVKVTDGDNKTNTYKQTVYVSESNNPLAHMDLNYGALENPIFDEGACSWEWAYIIDRVNPIRFDASESINIDGSNAGLEYSWKIGQGKFASSSNMSHRFDEIGCFPVKLTVKSWSNGKTDVREAMVEVRNLDPVLSSVSINIENPEEDPLIVRVTAQWAEDPDGVIQSYLWYYYTDIDTEPQDFRSTASASTAFVIPKVTGNYYFVAILKDNNESRVTSEDVTGSRYFTTITWDNVNTPIIDLSVNDNSTVIGEEITFTAKAQNILGQSIDKDASFSWDFDGDGFYDTQTSEATTTYVYRKSWEFYAKVKVKYRGISSTKNVTMNVSNKLVPDFGYISVGNTFIFFDSSTWQIDGRQWDLWDGTTKTWTNFSHTYTDKVTSHTVTLKISEWTKVKQVQKKVTKNIKNILKTKGKSFAGFSFPEADTDGNITLESSSEKVFVYMGEWGSQGDIYAIDYDIENDSDLNGGVDDDEDNIGTASYSSWDITQIPLNKYKVQKIRLYRKSSSGNVISSQDITIIKNYIEESDIDPDTLVFEWVTDSEKEKIEKLKSILSELPQQQRLESLSYVQKLQEDWNDNTEKTRTILDFENYIFEQNLEQEDELIEILESLLVEGQEDQSAKQITYTALINLIPQDIECTVETGSCYDSLLSKLEDIRNSDDVEYNKTLGKEILEVVGASESMTNSQKLDFKAILASLVYGDVESIPDEEKQEVIAEEIPVEESSEWESSGIMWVLLTVLKWLGILIGVFLLLVLALYILYLLFNRDKSIWFSQFIGNITSFWKNETQESEVNTQSDDILADFDSSADPLTEESDILSSVDEPKIEKAEKVTKSSRDDGSISPDTPAGDDILWSVWEWEDVPDWLKWNFNSDKSEVKVETQDAPTSQVEDIPKQDTSKKGWEVKTDAIPKEKTDIDAEAKVDEESVPDWLKGAEDSPKQVTEAVKTEPVADIQKEKSVKADQLVEEKIDLDAETKIGEDNVPDWLKWAVDFSEKAVSPETDTAGVKADTPENSVPKTQPDSGTPSQALVVDNSWEAKVDEGNVPDWLKGSFDTPKDTSKDIKVEDDAQYKEKEIVSKDIPEKKPKSAKTKTTWEKSWEKKVQTKDASKQDTKTETPEKKVKNKIPEKKLKAEVSKEATQEWKQVAKPVASKDKESSSKDSSKKTDGDELWDDGMKIPDWLKSDE